VLEVFLSLISVCHIVKPKINNNKLLKYFKSKMLTAMRHIINEAKVNNIINFEENLFANLKTSSLFILEEVL